MTTLALSDAPGLPTTSTSRATRPSRFWAGGLVTLAVASALLTIWGSWEGSRSDYYAAIAVSMSKSWPNFFFGAFDPAGTVTLDKIPGSFWIPALFVKLFGFSTFTVVLPNALAAVATVLVVAITARRLAGTAAGLIAGAVVASTPILVAVSRSNQPESFFVLGLALTAWAAVHAVQRAQLRWLMLAGVFVAAAFQCYMLEAWAVWPALAAAYLCTRQPLTRRIWHLLVAGFTSAGLSVAWIATVALIPASARPYIGSTLHDDPWEMVFGYNGLGRFGQATADASAYNSFTPGFSGDAGVLRLFNTQLAGQIGWLVPAALLAVAVLIALRVPARVWVLIGGWLATFLVMFSAVAGMHQFYTAALAVPMALAIGAAVGLSRQRGVRWPQIALVAVSAATAVPIALVYGGYSVTVAVVQAVLAAGAIALIVVGRPERWMRRTTAALTVAAMLLTPTAWSIVTLWHPSATNPVAGGVSDMSGLGGGGRSFAFGGQNQPGFGAQGPGGQAPAGQGPGAGDGRMPPTLSGGGAPAGTPNGGRFGGGLTGSADDSALLSYVEAHAGTAKYAVAVFGAQAAAPLIIGSNGASVLPIGGFSGNDPVPSLDAFTAMVAAGDVKYVVTSGRGGGFGGQGTTTSSQIKAWVESSCTAVADADVTGLYDCSGAQ